MLRRVAWTCIRSPGGVVADRRDGHGEGQSVVGGSAGQRLLVDPAADPGSCSQSSIMARLGGYGLASRMRLNGVSAARRIRVKPASRRISVSRASPACAPSAARGSSVIEWATQMTVDAP